MAQKQTQRGGMSSGGAVQGQSSGARAKIQFWEDKGAKRIDPLLFSQKAEEMAKDLAEENRRQNKLNKRTQLRKFYDEVLRLDDLAQGKGMVWDAVIPQIHMLVAKTAYANGRELVSNAFLQFMKDSVAQVESPEDLRVFANFFEAFMGFYRLHGPKN